MQMIPPCVPFYQSVIAYGPPNLEGRESFLDKAVPVSGGKRFGEASTSGNQDIYNCVDGKHKLPKSVMMLEMMVKKATTASQSQVLTSHPKKSTAS